MLRFEKMKLINKKHLLVIALIIMGIVSTWIVQQVNVRVVEENSKTTYVLSNGTVIETDDKPIKSTHGLCEKLGLSDKVMLVEMYSETSKKQSNGVSFVETENTSWSWDEWSYDDWFNSY